ncbi:NACHT domain-containing NTPase [Microbispora sp. GKU 823]|uniref:NACHT domain-containing protein n=1 Tax=Microbispora sp. GKU 823 TaxID=1652100 RepID=UPI0009A25BF0|nr:NACHT domain-containing protein [Microbispora sp. GKU 823]
MSGIEAAIVSLGGALVKSATKLWLGDKGIAADTTANAIDLLSNRATGLLEKRRTQRVFEQLADTIAAKIQPFIEAEFGGLPENEKRAAIDAVRDTFEQASLSDSELFAQDLNSGYLNTFLRARMPGIARKALLSTQAIDLYNILLRESCDYLIQVTIALPEYSRNALTEILRRESDIVKSLAEMLSRLPERREGLGHNDFEIYYRRQVSKTLDKMELFGATLTEASRRYRLSVAYLSLSVISEDADNKPTSQDTDIVDVAGLGVPVELALSAATRLFLRGTAGCGKTTLLRWIAVKSALSEFPDTLASWNNTVPFFIPLRRYVGRDLPAPENFLESVGRHIADEMPKGWVQEQLRAGRALVLVDGLDELPQVERTRARTWLQELIAAFPNSRYLVTSRPGAAPPSWLRGEDFRAFELQPMALADIKAFVRQWHDALSHQTLDEEEKLRIEQYADNLINKIVGQRHLRSLAETPLLCALLCALHYDRKSHLPRNRMELYDVALDMLLERRDAERNVASEVIMSRTDKFLLLRDIAYWLIRNGLSDAKRTRVLDRIAQKLQYMTSLSSISSEDAYRHLLERSGLIREPTADRMDFVHRTFEEYLAAIEALSNDDIGLLVGNAHLDQWREVVIMAAGHAYAPKREELLRSLIARGDKEPSHSDQLYLLAVACLETSPELSVETRDEIRKRVAKLLPPSSITIAKSLASAGEFVADLLAEARPTSARTTAATIRAAAQIGTEEGLRIIERYKEDKRQTVQNELLTSWSRFDPDEYALKVLRYSPLSKTHIYVNSAELVAALRHLPHAPSVTIETKSTLDISCLRNHLQLQQLAIWNSSIDDLTPITNAPLALLRLAGCRVTSLSPLAAIHSLRVLQFTNVASENSDFAFLGELPNLEQLLLSRVDLSSPLPSIQAQSLKMLRLHHLALQGLPSFGGAPNLTHVSIIGTPITDVAPLSALQELRHLNISSTQVNDLEPLLGHKLEALHASHTKIDNILPISQYGNLRGLHLNGTPVTDLTPLAELEKLEELSLDGSLVVDLSPLASNHTLESLDVENTAIEDLSPLTNHPALRSVLLRGTNVTDFSPLATIPTLKAVYLTKPTSLSDHDLMAMLGNREELNIHWDEDLSLLRRVE